MAGGVVETDRERLQIQALQFLQVVAQEQLTSSLTGSEFLADSSVRLEEIVAADFSHEVGQVTDRLSLRLEALVTGTIINPAQATTIAIAELQKATPDAFTLALDTVQLTPLAIVAVDEAGRVTFGLKAEAQAAWSIPHQRQ